MSRRRALSRRAGDRAVTVYALLMAISMANVGWSFGTLIAAHAFLANAVAFGLRLGAVIGMLALLVRGTCVVMDEVTS